VQQEEVDKVLVGKKNGELITRYRRGKSLGPPRGTRGGQVQEKGNADAICQPGRIIGKKSGIREERGGRRLGSSYSRDEDGWGGEKKKSLGGEKVCAESRGGVSQTHIEGGNSPM